MLFGISPTIQPNPYFKSPSHWSASQFYLSSLYLLWLMRHFIIRQKKIALPSKSITLRQHFILCVSSGHGTASTGGSNTRAASSLKGRGLYSFVPDPFGTSGETECPMALELSLGGPRGLDWELKMGANNTTIYPESILRRQVAGNSLLSQLSPITPICVDTHAHTLNTRAHTYTHHTVHMCAHTCSHLLSTHVPTYIHMLSIHVCTHANTCTQVSTHIHTYLACVHLHAYTQHTCA